MNRVTSFFDSMTGRIFVILVLGIALAGSAALLVADARRQAELDGLQRERAIERLQAFVADLNFTPPAMRRAVAERGADDVGLAPEALVLKGEDRAMARALRALNGATATRVYAGTEETCRLVNRGPGRRFGGRGDRRGPGEGRGFRDGPPPGAGFGPMDARPRGPGKCWAIDLALADGQAMRLTLNTPPRPVGPWRALDPLFLLVLVLVGAGLAFILARMTGAPIRHLAQAARELGGRLDRDPLPETGPREVRDAAQAFNAMQQKLQHTLAERTHLLAAITHDLQTPLTRLRLRLEKVEDGELRDRLVGDLAAMQALIREGLDLARSSETTEPFVVLDLDSLLQSLVEDEAGAGRNAVFLHGAGRDVRVRAQALRRCLVNLIDNAIAYGDRAEVSAAEDGGDLVITVRDHGPGIPEGQLEAVFDPMVRLEDSRSRETGGTGLGLTIARRLAGQNGGTLTLANHPEGGCVAQLVLPATSLT
jgi:signal transduction histidine kinase